MADDCCISLEELKKEYERFRKKYSLPSFEDMNKDFEIEKLQERETDTLLREVRRTMGEKNVAYLKFAEMFMNPATAPMFFLALVKSLDTKEKKLLEDLYLELGRYEIRSISLDNKYDEKRDAIFINDFYKKWQEIKDKFDKILKAIEDTWDKKSEKNSKGYLG